MSRTGYARLSNEFWRAPAVMEMLDVNPAAVGFYVASVSYASDNLTDGLIEERVAKYSLRVPDDVIAYLVAEGKWEPVENGWIIHNYTKWQNSREQIEAKRERDRNRKANDRSESVPDGFQTDSARNPNGSRAESEQQLTLTKTKTNNQSSFTQVVEEVNSVCAHAREAAPTATEGEREPDEANVLDAWSPSEADLATASGLGVDGEAVARKLRDKLTRKGFEACGVNRRTTAALDATFRSWVEHGAQWAGERPKPVKSPPAVKTAPRKATSWNDPKVMRLLEPYKTRFPPRGKDDLGPSRDWYEACRHVAAALDAGVGEADVERVFSAAGGIHDAKSVKTALETTNPGTP